MNPTIRDVEWAVCTKFNIQREWFHSGRPRDKLTIARSRHIAMFLARELTGASYPKIGRYFGKDHTTVMHGLRRVAALCASNPKVAAHVAECRAALAVGVPARFAADKAWAAKLQQGVVSWPVDNHNP